MKLTAAALTIVGAILAIWTYRAEAERVAGPPGWLLIVTLSAAVVAFVVGVVLAARQAGTGRRGWILPTAALALGVGAVVVARSRDADLDGIGCATVLPVEPLFSLVIVWGALLVAGAGVLYAISRNSKIAIAYAAVTVLIIGYVTFALHDDANWRLHNDKLGIEKCQE